MTMSTLGTASDIGRRRARNVDKVLGSPVVKEPMPVEQSFDHATRRAGIGRSAPTRLHQADAVTARGGHVGLVAQSKPDLARLDAVGEGFGCGPVTHTGQSEVGDQA